MAIFIPESEYGNLTLCRETAYDIDKNKASTQNRLSAPLRLNPDPSFPTKPHHQLSDAKVLERSSFYYNPADLRRYGKANVFWEVIERYGTRNYFVGVIQLTVWSPEQDCLAAAGSLSLRQ